MFKRRELKKLHAALGFAVDYNESLIDAHRIQWARGPNAYRKSKVVPKEFRNDVSRWERQNEAWKLLQAKIRELLWPTKTH